MKHSLAVLLGFLLVATVTLTRAQALPAGSDSSIGFRPGEVWLDTSRKPIQAHSAGILYKDGVYYWYGEDKAYGDLNKVGVSCYSSRDLYNWKREGVALPKESLPEQFRDAGICERPKVLYNSKTRQYVMWMHLDDKDYLLEEAGVAVSDAPTGPFRLLSHSRPIRYNVPDPAHPDEAGSSWVVSAMDRWRKLRQKELGGPVADMNLFLDDDGKAYVFYASENDLTMYVSRLNAEFTAVETPTVEGKTWARILVDQHREAPAPFKCNGKYYLITSACTGWDPNPSSYAVASNILGPWTNKGNPAVGPEAETTFRSQSTFVLKAPGKPANCFIYLGDRWRRDELEASRYVWLPFTIREDGSFTLVFRPHWNLSIFDTAQ